jgi:hypothetical protein
MIFIQLLRELSIVHFHLLVSCLLDAFQRQFYNLFASLIYI